MAIYRSLGQTSWKTYRDHGISPSLTRPFRPSPLGFNLRQQGKTILYSTTDILRTCISIPYMGNMAQLLVKYKSFNSLQKGDATTFYFVCNKIIYCINLLLSMANKLYYSRILSYIFPYTFEREYQFWSSFYQEQFLHVLIGNRNMQCIAHDWLTLVSLLDSL